MQACMTNFGPSWISLLFYYSLKKNPFHLQWKITVIAVMGLLAAMKWKCKITAETKHIECIRKARLVNMPFYIANIFFYFSRIYFKIPQLSKINVFAGM